MNRPTCLAWLLLCVCACSGGETGNPPAALDGFETPGCKSDLVTKSDGASHALATNNPRYDGLTCFVWERLSEDSLRIEVTNHADGCGADQVWAPSADLNDAGELELRLDNPSCARAGCVSCIYDLSFTVSVPEMTADLDVVLYGDRCDGPAAVEGRATLALTTANRGESCVYVDFGSARWSECMSGGNGRRFAPCVAIDDCLELGDHCEEGLVCGEAVPGEPRCFPRCDAEADCASYPGTHCQGGGCQL